MAEQDISFSLKISEEDYFLYIMLPDNDNYVRIALDRKVGGDGQINLSLLLESVNTANLEVSFAKTILHEDTLYSGVEFQCDSIGLFKVLFPRYLRSVLAIDAKIETLMKGLDERKADWEQSKTAYDKIHYHTSLCGQSFCSL